MKLDDLVKLLIELNSSVPHFSVDELARYPYERTVQQPLLQLFEEYIGSHLFLIQYFSTDNLGGLFLDHSHAEDMLTSISPATNPIQGLSQTKYLEETAKKLEEAKTNHDMMLQLAEQNEATRKVNDLQDEDARSYDSQARFVRRRQLGEGAFGIVHEVEETSTGAVYARKHISFCSDSSDSEQKDAKVLKEVNIMQKLRHPHIATVCFYTKEPGRYSIFMLPVADVDLLHYLDKYIDDHYPAASVRFIYSWFGSLLDALAYAHKQHIKHRDVKPSNILIKDGQPYLTDFGLARDFSNENTSVSQGPYKQGTPLYYAPEKRLPKRGCPTDIFALGCVFSEMLTVAKGKSLRAFKHYRRSPESGRLEYAFRENLPKVKEWLDLLEKDPVSDLLTAEIQSMLHKKPRKRPSAEESVQRLRREPALFC